MCKTLMFGSFGAVLHYNTISRIVDELVSRLFGIPMIRYCDDFGALLPASIAHSGLAAYARRCELLDIGIKTTKSDVGSNIALLVLIGPPP